MNSNSAEHIKLKKVSKNMDANLIRRKEAIVSRAKNGAVVVKFTKKDGSARTLIGTLISKVVPETKGVRTSSEDVVTLYDIEKSDWRSVRVDSIESYASP